MTSFRRVVDRTREPGDPAGDRPPGPRYLFTARFSATDAMLLRELVSQIAELVGGPPAEGAPAEGLPVEGPPPGMPAADVSADFADALGLTEDASLPDDPALARLLPDAYPDDPGASGEFRRYTEKDLRAAKIAAARTVLDTLPEGGGRIRLSQPQAEIWLRAINDIRLALGVRLSITEDMYEEMGRIKPDDARYTVLAVYDWLSGTQESLVHALW
ncbi:MAG TPA: DUF2017 domain-containing protein [Streptosporangiaceae bacterium]|nr:DUF2017 domain-containing protein [Streptosporangiaceae bacterium]